MVLDRNGMVAEDQVAIARLPLSGLEVLLTVTKGGVKRRPANRRVSAMSSHSLQDGIERA